MPPRYGAKASILLVFAIALLAALDALPGRASAHGTIVDPWPGEPGFDGFVPGHEMDYILDVFWRPKEYTRIGLQDFQACGDMRFRKDGEIHYTKYGTKNCPNKQRYRLVEANPDYITLFVEDLDRTIPAYTKEEYIYYGYWVLSHETPLALVVHRCTYSPAPDKADYVGPEGFTMPRQDLIDKWNKSIRCNPKLLPSDRDDYFGDNAEGYYVIRSNGSPAYRDNGFIYDSTGK